MRVIRPRLRLERQIFHHHLQPQTPHHVIEHMIVTVSQPELSELQRNVAVAEMIGGAGQQPGIGGARRRDRFARRRAPDRAPS
jgi:hypothetical protein